MVPKGLKIYAAVEPKTSALLAFVKSPMNAAKKARERYPIPKRFPCGFIKYGATTAPMRRIADVMTLKIATIHAICSVGKDLYGKLSCPFECSNPGNVGSGLILCLRLRG
jgi:hypothetical protein